MKNVCLSARQEDKYLRNAKEIKFEYRDRKAIPDYAEKYPEATIILTFTPGNIEIIDWTEIKNYNILCKEKFIFGIYKITDAEKCKELGIKFYFGYPITSYYELFSIIKMEPAYIRLGAPLFFEIEKIHSACKIPIRAVPNVCYIDGLPRENGINGTWIRPEDYDIYEEYISIYEFEDCDLQKERALYRIYMEEKKWPGEFNLLFTNFNYDGVNRMILPDMTKQRLNCGQRCATLNGNCRICYRLIDLANPEKIKKYVDDIKNN